MRKRNGINSKHQRKTRKVLFWFLLQHLSALIHSTCPTNLSFTEAFKCHILPNCSGVCPRGQRVRRGCGLDMSLLTGQVEDTQRTRALSHYHILPVHRTPPPPPPPPPVHHTVFKLQLYVQNKLIRLRIIYRQRLTIRNHSYTSVNRSRRRRRSKSKGKSRSTRKGRSGSRSRRRTSKGRSGSRSRNRRRCSKGRSGSRIRRSSRGRRSKRSRSKGRSRGKKSRSSHALCLSPAAALIGPAAVAKQRVVWCQVIFSPSEQTVGGRELPVIQDETCFSRS